MAYTIKQGQTTQALLFLLVSSTDHVTPKTGVTPTVTISKNGGTYASPLGTVSEIGNGLYKVAGNAIDSGTLGPLALHATAAGADPVDVVFLVVAYDPLTANLGLSNVSADVAQWAGAAVATPNTAGVPRVDIAFVDGETAKTYDGIAQAGTATAITLDANEDAAANTLIGRRITIVAGTGIGQSRIITVYAGTSTRIATVHKAWDVTPDATSQYVLDATAEADLVAVGHVDLGVQVGVNLNAFFQNAGGSTSKVVDDVGSGGTSAWTSGERAQLRYRLGIDGTATAPVSGAPALGTVDARVASIAPNTIDATSLAASAVTAFQFGLASATSQASISANVASILGQTGTTGVKVVDKDGYRLAPTGLDAISVADPGGVAGMNTLPKLIVALWRRQFKKTSLGVSSGLQTFGDDGLTVNTAQTLTDDGTTQTIEAA